MTAPTSPSQKPSSQDSFDAIVIGSGPGGYVCAIKLASLGVRTAIIERESLGGVCLNVGCIPSKALIHAGNTYEDLNSHVSEMGIKAEVKGIDLKTLVGWKDSIVKKLTSGVGTLLKGNGVEIIAGKAKFENDHTLLVDGPEGKRTLKSKTFVIATGSRPVEIPGFAVDGKDVLSSTEALSQTELPEHLVVIGGGYIGLELGTYYRKIGSKVTVLEGMKDPLATMDKDCVNVVLRGLKKRGVEILTETKAVAYKKVGKKLEVEIQTPQGTQKIPCDKILVTVGRKPNSDNLGLDRAGLTVDARGFLKIDSQCRTQVPHIFAIGDVAGGMLLAHKASKEGIVAAEVIAGLRASSFDTTIIPAVVFTDPEIAAVGLTLPEAQAQGKQVISGQFPFAALGKALASGHSEGFVKIIADANDHKVLGVHIVGTDASSLLGEAGLAIEMGATLEDLAQTIHAHPTLPEALMEAADVTLGHPIHILKKR